ncbi:hypothetical protein CXF97_12720 [Pseudomonas sp. Choline-02u-1]|nr:hypothetical protein CXF97_12720 [Pseudomonas sp. Choline-02u-1]
MKLNGAQDIKQNLFELYLHLNRDDISEPCTNSYIAFASKPAPTGKCISSVGAGLLAKGARRSP